LVSTEICISKKTVRFKHWDHRWMAKNVFLSIFGVKSWYTWHSLVYKHYTCLVSVYYGSRGAEGQKSWCSVHRSVSCAKGGGG
jgi:hypothetical protein